MIAYVSYGCLGIERIFEMSAELRIQSEEDIIRRILDGEANAFEHLLNGYKNHVLAIVKRHIPFDHVEEMVQEVFIKAYKALPTLKQKNRFKPWVSTIAVRTCKDFWREQYRSREKAISELTDRQQDWLIQVLNEQAGQSFDEFSKQEEAREVLDWALNQLSPKDRMIMELVYLEDHSVKEAAELMEMSISSIKVRAFRSKRKLSKLLSTQAMEHRRVL